MKNKWIRSIAVLAISVVTVIGINAQNQGGKGQGPYGEGYGTGAYGYHGKANRPGARAEFMQEKLNLTEEQKAEIKEMRLANYKEMKPLKAKMSEINASQRSLMAEEEVDVKAVNKLIDEKTALMNQIQKKQVSHKLAFKEILTDEQEMMLDQKRRTAGKGQGRRR